MCRKTWFHNRSTFPRRQPPVEQPNFLERSTSRIELEDDGKLPEEDKRLSL